MLCEELMKRGVECLSPNETAQVAARRMRDTNIGFLPICDPTGKVLGTLTDRDIAVRLVADSRPLTTAVTDLMTRDVVACRPKDDIRRAEQLMSQHHKSRIVCLDDSGRLVGVISLSDIAQREDDAHAAETMRHVTEREVHP